MATILRGSDNLDSSKVLSEELAGSIVTDASGRVTMPYQPAFKVSQSQFSATSAGYTTMQFNTSEGNEFNIGNHFNTSTNIFTAPVAGVYFFSADLRIDLANDYFRILITKNDANNINTDLHSFYGSMSGSYDSMRVAGTMYLNANDNVRVNIDSHNDSSWNSQGEGFFCGYLLG